MDQREKVMKGRMINDFLHRLSIGHTPQVAFDLTVQFYEKDGSRADKLHWPSNLDIKVVPNNATQRGSENG